jgi:uncharacterized protein (DUF885 family)
MTARACVADAVGPERYAVASRLFLGADVDLREAYDWGFEELAALEAEMAATAEQITPGEGVEAAMEALDEDPARRLDDPAAFAAWMQDLADRAVAALADVHFSIPPEIRTLRCRIAPQRDGGIYYTGPSEDLTRPGTMWWSLPDDVGALRTWQETSTVFHEGVPGHHLQVAQTMLRHDELNRWQRLLCWVSGHGEGWALYAERLMADLGWLDDPGDHLGMLDMQRFRAARVCVDLGLHCGFPVPTAARDVVGDAWTADGMARFLRAHSRVDDAMLRFEVDRYLGYPGQAPSYKLGERLWTQARDAARERAGASFDLRDFHDRALALGSIGLALLAESLLDA